VEIKTAPFATVRGAVSVGRQVIGTFSGLANRKGVLTTRMRFKGRLAAGRYSGWLTVTASLTCGGSSLRKPIIIIAPKSTITKRPPAKCTVPLAVTVRSIALDRGAITVRIKTASKAGVRGAVSVGRQVIGTFHGLAGRKGVLMTRIRLKGRLAVRRNSGWLTVTASLTCGASTATHPITITGKSTT